MGEVAAAGSEAVAPAAGAGPKWPGESGAGIDPPVSGAALLNAAARAAASNSRRDLVAYLRLRRKTS